MTTRLAMLCAATTAVVIIAGACGNPAGSGSLTSTASPTAAPTSPAPASSPTNDPTYPTPESATEDPQPAGANPSVLSQMVCGKAQTDIANVLGVTPVRIDTPTWIDDVYSCRYVYPTGSFTLSVKELSSWPETIAYFQGQAAARGNTGVLDGLGQAAFTTRDNSVVVRKDWKVLFVDIHGLPPQLGNPAASPPEVALYVATVIMDCWAGD